MNLLLRRNILHYKNNVLVFILITLLFAEKTINHEVTLFLETSQELIDFNRAIERTLHYDVTKDINSSRENSNSNSAALQYGLQIKSAFAMKRFKRAILYPTIIGKVNFKNMSFSTTSHWTSSSAYRSNLYLGLAPQLQLFNINYDSPMHFNIIPQVGLAGTKISGATDKDVKVIGAKAGLGATFQIKTNKKREKTRKFEGISLGTGFTYEHHLKGNQKFGRVYGETVGMAYDKTVSLPTGLYLIYFNIGYTIKKERNSI